MTSPRRAILAAWSPLIERGWVRQLVGHGSVYSLGTFVQMAGALVAIAVLTRLLEPAEYGLAVTAMLVGQVLVSPASAGIPAAAGRIWFEPRSGPEDARRLLLVVPVSAAVICGLADLTSGVWARALTDHPMDLTLRLGVWSAVPLACFAASQSLLLSQQRPAAYGGLTAGTHLGGQLLGLVLAASGGRAHHYLIGIVIGLSVGTVVSVALAGPRAKAPDRRALRAAATLGLPTIPHLLALQLIAGADRAVIARYGDLTDVGRYQVAYAVGSVGLAAFGAFTQALAPMIQGADDADRWHLLASMSKLLHRLAAVVVVSIALAAPLGLGVVAPSSYDRGPLVLVASVVALAAMAYVGYASVVQVLFEVQRPGVLAIATPAIAVASIVANIVVVPKAGIEGAAVVTVLTYVAMAGVTWYRSGRLASVPWGYRTVAGSWGVAIAGVAVSAALPTSAAWIGGRLVLATIGVGVAARLFLRLADASRPQDVA